MALLLKQKLQLTLMYEATPGKLVEYPLGDQCHLTELCISESTKLSIPTINLILEDGGKFFSNYPVLDGRLLVVSLMAESVALTQSVFRVYSYKSDFNGKNDTYTISGYFDCPKYWCSSSCQGYVGTSGEVIQQVATLCGLKADTVTTHDSQLWMQGNKTYHDFVKYLTDNGFKANNSYLVSGVTLDGTLIHRDVTKLTSPLYKVVTHGQSNNCYTATDFDTRSNSGVNNITGGYASVMVNDNLNTITSYKQVTVNNAEPNMSVNSDLVKTIKRNKVYFSDYGVDCNESYWLGRYQNDRLSKVYSVVGEFMFDSPTKLSLLTPFQVAVNDTRDTTNDKESGLYIVDSRTIYIRGITYAERISASRKGFN